MLVGAGAVIQPCASASVSAATTPRDNPAFAARCDAPVEDLAIDVDESVPLPSPPLLLRTCLAALVTVSELLRLPSEPAVAHVVTALPLSASHCMASIAAVLASGTAAAPVSAAVAAASDDALVAAAAAAVVASSSSAAAAAAATPLFSSPVCPLQPVPPPRSMMTMSSSVPCACLAVSNTSTGMTAYGMEKAGSRAMKAVTRPLPPLSLPLLLLPLLRPLPLPLPPPQPLPLPPLLTPSPLPV